MKLSSWNLELVWLPQAPERKTPFSHPAIPCYRVGERLQPGRRQWPEGAQYGYGPEGHELTIFHAEIDEELIQDIKAGEAEFALTVRHPLLLLAYRFGRSIEWSDVPYNWHVQPPSRRAIPPLEKSTENRALLWVTLVGANDGVIHAQRGIALAPEFTARLQNAIREQTQSPLDSEECLATVGDLMVSYFDTLSRLHLAQSRTLGNR
jgi:hypothetical protein